MKIGITKMSSKGQIVIPVDMREKFKEGVQFIIMQRGNQMILKPTEKVSKQMAEDIEFARRTEAAYQRYKQGKFITMDYDDFLKRLKNGIHKARSRV